MQNTSRVFGGAFWSSRCMVEGGGLCSKCTALPTELQCGWCTSIGECTMKHICEETYWMASGSQCVLEDIIGFFTILTVIGIMVVLVLVLFFIVLIADQIALIWTKENLKPQIATGGNLYSPMFHYNPKQSIVRRVGQSSKVEEIVCDTRSTPTSSFDGTMFNSLSKSRTLKSTNEPRSYFKKFPSSFDPDLSYLRSSDLQSKWINRGSVLFYQTKEELSSKRCSVVTTKTMSAAVQDISCETSLVPTGNNQFYLIVQINVDPKKSVQAITTSGELNWNDGV